MSYSTAPRQPESSSLSAGKLYMEFRTFGGYFTIADLNNDGNFRLHPVCLTADAIMYVARNADAIQEHADLLYILCMGDGAEHNN